MYEFRSCMIPKGDDENSGYRPLAVIESVLMIFHRIIKNSIAKNV